ncbi:MAG: NAD+ synthase, partial [Treponema sp.]|nr:NAD+ synthase [Treponema sp.]
MRIAIAQINSTIGDFPGNREKILAFSRRAAERGAELVLFPELAVCGYPPMDLLDQDRFVELNIGTVHVLQRELPQNLAVGLGFVNRSPYPRGKSLVNEYAVLLGGKIAFEQVKTLLPTYDVFDEARNFEPGRAWDAFEFRGERIGFAVCEDVWRETDIPGTSYERDPVRELLKAGVSILCVPSASPYVAGKLKVRRALAERIAARGGIPLVYINAVGANDQILFDGRSFVTLPAGQGALNPAASGAVISGPAISAAAVPGPAALNPLPAVARAFEEDLLTWDSKGAAAVFVAASAPTAPTNAAAPPNAAPSHPDDRGDDPYNVGLSLYELDILEEGLVMGIRDYMKKCGFVRAHLGLSGGIDSALV